jgi:CHAT domain/Metallo-beta-lactamase superfamily
MIDIRRVDVELLRRGPRHNQLLSPLTDYLAVCGDFPGGVVRVPYEQAEVENLLDDLRYAVAATESSDRLAVIRDRAGNDLAAMLAQVPGLPGVLAGERPDSACLTHLRMIVSSAELALLPFELSKIPVGAGSVGDGWLALQPDRPLCLTRHVRGAMATARGWPTKPRILFVSGDDVPFEQHLQAFERVLEPWRTDELEKIGERTWTSEYLTVIERASLDQIHAVVTENQFTHVHVLAHGAEIEHRRSVRHGIAIGDRVVTGADLALALASSVTGRRNLPSVVTMASCDSAAQGSVLTPGGSVAHDLHASGIPLVVASQFPISKEASVPFVETFYQGQLDGDHPLETVCEVRRRLATEFDEEHAWASIVVYEALPADFDDRLAELQYWQSRRAHERALKRLELTSTSDTERIDRLDRTGSPFAPDFASPEPGDLDALVAAVTTAAERLPTDGAFASESDGLRAAGLKRSAEVAYWLSRAPDIDATRADELLEQCFADLVASLERYTSAMNALLSAEQGVAQRKVTLHWLVGQVVLVAAVVGADIDPDLAGIARATARLDLNRNDAVVRGWAVVSLIEQALLQLAVDGPSASAAGEALRCASELVGAMGYNVEHVDTTRRQMRRYVSWWGDERFTEALAALGAERRVAWDGESGVVATARAVIDVLTPRHRAPSTPGRPPVTSAPARPTAAAVPTGPLLGTAPAPAPARPADDADNDPPTGRFSIEVLPARNGDCLWLTYGDDEVRHVLVDCGSADVADIAGDRVRSVDRVELFVLTHIDADHITGAIPLFSDADVASRFGDVWFNGWKQLGGFLSVDQGEQFSKLLGRDDRSFLWNGAARDDDPPPPIVTVGPPHPVFELKGGLRLTVLSPTPSGLTKLARRWAAALAELDRKRAMLGRRARPVPPADPGSLDLDDLAASGPTKDSSVPNLSSIAVLAEFGGRSVLLTGDAHADVLAASIRSLQESRGRAGERLRLDALKLSHHGSANATTKELLDVVDCGEYLVPTDGSIFYHPDREAIARVVVHGGVEPRLHFNYRTDLNGFWDDADLKGRYGYRTVYPEAGSGLVVEL